MSLPLPPGVRLPARHVWLNGRLVRGEDAALSVFDRGARDGGAIFETLRVYDGQPFAWERHMERLVLSAAELGFPVPPAPARLRDAIDEVLAAEGLRDAVVRITVTRGIPGGRPVRTGAWVDAEALSGRLWPGTRTVHADDGGPAGARLIPSQTPFAAGWITRHKTTSRLAYDLAREEARAANADEALLVTRAGQVLEGAASNLFAVLAGGELITPPLAADVLPGVTRAIVLSLCGPLGITAREGELTLESLRAAREVFLTNSVQQVLPVSSIGAHRVPGRATALRLLAAYRETVAAAARV